MSLASSDRPEPVEGQNLVLWEGLEEQKGPCFDKLSTIGFGFSEIGHG